MGPHVAPGKSVLPSWVSASLISSASFLWSRKDGEGLWACLLGLMGPGASHFRISDDSSVNWLFAVHPPSWAAVRREEGDSVKAWALPGSLASSQEVLLIHLQAPAPPSLRLSLFLLPLPKPFQVPKNPSLTSLTQFLSPPSELLSPCGRLSQAQHGGCSDRVTLCWGVCPAHWRMFGSIPGLYPLNARNISTSLVVTSQTISRHCQASPGSGIQESLSQMTVWIAELKTILLSLGLVGRVL